MSGVTLRGLVAGDWDRVSAIYRQGMDTGDATFETQVPTWDVWDAGRLAQPRLVAVLDGAVVGFAALSPTSSRRVYAGVAEVMVYVDPAVRGQGVGGTLMQALIPAAESAGIWTLQAGIFPENQASVRLHLGVGFRTVGTRERLGRSADGRWRDVLLLERRSPVVGTE